MFVSLYQMRRDAMSQARDATENLASSLEKETERNLDVFQLAMREVATSIKTPTLLRLPLDVRQLVAFSTISDAKELGTLSATDAAGNFILDSRSPVPRKLNVSDQDYFQVQQQSRDIGLYLSKPFIPKTGDSRQPTIALSLRLEKEDGQFAGIVAGTLRLNYFHDMFKDAILGQHGTITLLRTDGTVLMRQPYHPGDVGSTLAGGHSFLPLVQSDQGSYVDVAVLDHIERQYSFKRIGKYPLIVVVGFATEDIYAGWHRRAVAIGAVTVVIDVLSIWLSLMFASLLRRRLEMESQLQQLAWFDSLTGLPNRIQLQREAGRILAHAKQNASDFATLFIDLDRFKRVNDTQGHAVGDEVLREIAERLRKHVHTGDSISRLGGDEFLAILQDCDVLKAMHVAERILHTVREPIALDSKRDTRITISTSIGIAMYPYDGLNIDVLLRNADMAMYQAKSAGRNRIHFYAPEYERKAREHLDLEIALQRDFEAKVLSVVYQPRVDATGMLCGAEALVRWYNDKMGFIPPDYFIPIAEESGLIAELDAWVLGEACRQLAAWRASGLAVPSISVNVCAMDLKRSDYPGFVTRTLEAHGLAPDDLILEMTERVMFDEAADDIRTSIDEIHAMGVTLAIDDFGTGFSSLNYLHRFPIKELKIDKSFIQGIGESMTSESLAQTIINIGKTLKLTVVAEGIETQAQRDFLSRHDCDLYQGHLFSPPLPPDDFALWAVKQSHVTLRRQLP
ncbi:bifunctional diguanylate cyclase/phosphodiesterase [Dyella psychrodurans]|uniref:EAL domain-containing protein n=1 Tax=Dyella psychrodurans TaxID=1927960 RepID=A0A370X6V5_9GAMM|nr:EAL domain-containing protein [Dyella psychrodurans]RDS84098.1 EAL domain-containing protein [Dyella psychrodurans]